MKIVLSRISLCAVALIFLATALQLYFIPQSTLDLFSISYSGSAGLSTLRGDLGGLFFSMCVFLLLGLRRHQRHWLLATVLIILFIVLGRVIGMVLDELTLHLVQITAIELVIVLMIAVPHHLLKQDDLRQ